MDILSSIYSTESDSFFLGKKECDYDELANAYSELSSYWKEQEDIHTGLVSMVTFESSDGYLPSSTVDLANQALSIVLGGDVTHHNISVESDSEEKKGFFRRIWDAIVSLFTKIKNAIKKFLGMKVDDIDKAEKEVKDAIGDVKAGSAKGRKIMNAIKKELEIDTGSEFNSIDRQLKDFKEAYKAAKDLSSSNTDNLAEFRNAASGLSNGLLTSLTESKNKLNALLTAISGSGDGQMGQLLRPSEVEEGFEDFYLVNNVTEITSQTYKDHSDKISTFSSKLNTLINKSFAKDGMKSAKRNIKLFTEDKMGDIKSKSSKVKRGELTLDIAIDALNTGASNLLDIKKTFKENVGELIKNLDILEKKYRAVQDNLDKILNGIHEKKDTESADDSDNKRNLYKNYFEKVIFKMYQILHSSSNIAVNKINHEFIALVDGALKEAEKVVGGKLVVNSEGRYEKEDD